MVPDEPENVDSKAKTLFLSYARTDRAVAERLANALRNAGFDVWWDALIEGGAVFTTSIETALDAADAVVVLWSKASIQSDWVRDEAGRGRDRKRLVPVTIDGSEPPLGFRQYHAIDLSKWRGNANEREFMQLVGSISGVTGHMGAVPSAFMTQPAPNRRAVLIGGIGATVLATSGGLLAWKTGRLGGGGPAVGTIAVLPFKNLSGDASQLYFSDGLTEEVRSALARNGALKVLAATSSETARDHREDAKTIAKKLGVAFLLEGSVRRAGDIVRIAAELTDGKTGFNKWSNTLDRKMADIFAVQSEIARTVSDALSVTMAAALPGQGGTASVAAYEALLKGRELYNSDSGEASDRAALAQFDAAIAADPDYADAHAARSRSLGAIANQYAKASELRGMYDVSIKAAQRAVALAPDLAAGHLALGYALYVGRLDAKGARVSYERAASLGAGDADILMLYAIYCARTARPADATKATSRAIELDPLNPRAFRSAGIVQFAARDYPEAIRMARQALSLNPELRNAHAHIGNALYMQNNLPEARAEFVTEKADLLRLPGLAIVEYRLGNKAEAERALASLIEKLGDSALYQQAQIFAQWGDSVKALSALDRARALGDSGLLITPVDPFLDPIRKDLRFIKLMTELNMV